MTIANALVLDGNEVLLRLHEERTATGSPVHIDWLRFTLNLRFAPVPTVDSLFPAAVVEDMDFWCMDSDKRHLHERREFITKHLRQLDDNEYYPSTQAYQLATDVCAQLGPDFFVDTQLKKGHDFYRYRLSIMRAGTECGWVGFLSSGDSPRQSAQSKTLHVNLYGAACTFAKPGWHYAMADYMEEHRAVVTRVDLALDFFGGIAGGMDRIGTDYDTGLMDHMGHRPKHNCVGAWRSGGGGRSFYFGSKAAGKQTNVYDKGFQLYGEQDATGWQRIEVRYGNQKRLLPLDVLRRPAGFFAGTSEWHLAMLHEHGEVVTPEPIKTEPRLAMETLAAECTRNARWFFSTAGKSAALAFLFMDRETLGSWLENCAELPGRLSKFKREEVERVYQNIFKKITGTSAGPAAFAA